ncbi:MAG: hypothetical protein HZB31_01520 [Nitrospirae bacterium]|nr:hypothetical protein [Nitrospirota bacterium]
MKTNKKSLKRKPKNVWNSVRKLEGYLKKADIQANVFMDSLQELRDEITLEVKGCIVRDLCKSVNGDILHELSEHKRRREAGRLGNSIEQNAVLGSIFDTLTDVLQLAPVRNVGERFSLSRTTAKDYEFDEHPQALDDEKVEHFEVEVLRCGWKVGSRLIVRPIVFEAGLKKPFRYEEPDPLANLMFVTSEGDGNDPGN